MRYFIKHRFYISQGDGGSPLVRSESTIMGILVTSVPCATGVPDLYTNVYQHLGFIQSILRDED
jgi:hypothetical protein